MLLRNDDLVYSYLKRSAVYRLSPWPCACGVTTLDNEFWDNPMKYGAIIVTCEIFGILFGDAVGI